MPSFTKYLYLTQSMFCRIGLTCDEYGDAIEYGDFLKDALDCKFKTNRGVICGKDFNADETIYTLRYDEDILNMLDKKKLVVLFERKSMQHAYINALGIKNTKFSYNGCINPRDIHILANLKNKNLRTIYTGLENKKRKDGNVLKALFELDGQPELLQKFF